MKKKILIFILIFLASFFATLWFKWLARPAEKGVAVQTIFIKLPKLPANIAQAINPYEKLLIKLRDIDGFSDEAIKRAYDLDIAALKKAGLENLSANNYVIRLPHLNYVIKIPSAKKIRNNYLVLLGREADVDKNILKDTDWQELYKQYEMAEVPTYQGISRAAIALRMQQAQSKGIFDQSILIPKTYMQRYADVSEEHLINDRTYFVVQEFVPMKKLNQQDLQNLSLAQIKELIKAAWAGYVWHIKDNIGLTSDGKIMFVDLEQPDRLNAASFYLKNEPRVQLFAIDGLKDLLIMLKGHKEFNKISEFVTHYFDATKFIKNDLDPMDHFNKTVKPLLQGK